MQKEKPWWEGSTKGKRKRGHWKKPRLMIWRLFKNARKWSLLQGISRKEISVLQISYLTVNHLMKICIVHHQSIQDSKSMVLTHKWFVWYHSIFITIFGHYWAISWSSNCCRIAVVHFVYNRLYVNRPVRYRQYPEILNINITTITGLQSAFDGAVTAEQLSATSSMSIVVM